MTDENLTFTVNGKTVEGTLQAAVHMLIRSLTEERDQLRIETARNSQRIARLRTVARMAQQHLDDRPRPHSKGACDCTECCLEAALDQLEEGDV